MLERRLLDISVLSVWHELPYQGDCASLEVLTRMTSPLSIVDG